MSFISRAGMGGDCVTLADSISKEYCYCAFIAKRGMHGACYRLMSWSSVNTLIFVPKLTEISLLQFSCAELIPVGLLHTIPQVHLLVSAGWWGQLVALGWARDRWDKDCCIFSQ
jgi:hypothetical protein